MVRQPPPSMNQKIDPYDLPLGIAMDTPCIFQLAGSASDVEEFRKLFEGGYIPDLDTASDPFVICDLLKVGLKSLTPCLDFTFWNRFDKEALKPGSSLLVVKFLRDLHSSHVHMLKQICLFLHRVCDYHSSNRMDSESLAKIFSPL